MDRRVGPRDAAITGTFKLTHWHRAVRTLPLGLTRTAATGTRGSTKAGLVTSRQVEIRVYDSGSCQAPGLGRTSPPPRPELQRPGAAAGPGGGVGVTGLSPDS